MTTKTIATTKEGQAPTTKSNAKKTPEQKKAALVGKLSKEIELIKYNPRMEILKNGMNKKMESYYFFIPNINSINAFNNFMLTTENKTDDIKLIEKFASNNNTCNKERCAICSQYCYCEKLKFYKNHMSSRFNILLSYLKESNKFFIRVNTQIIRDNIDLVRLHTEGDFFSREYVLQWFEVMKNNPSVKFYSYTKQFEYFEGLELPQNFTLQLSFDVNAEYEIPQHLLSQSNVNIYLTYDNLENVGKFVDSHKLENMPKKDCLGKCKKCRNCYTNSNNIHLCKIH